VAARLHPSAAR